MKFSFHTSKGTRFHTERAVVPVNQPEFSLSLKHISHIERVMHFTSGFIYKYFAGSSSAQQKKSNIRLYLCFLLKCFDINCTQPSLKAENWLLLALAFSVTEISLLTWKSRQLMGEKFTQTQGRHFKSSVPFCKPPFSHRIHFLPLRIPVSIPQTQKHLWSASDPWDQKAVQPMTGS